jgi:hypothetical protein
MSIRDSLRDQIVAALLLIERQGEMPDVTGIVEAMLHLSTEGLQYHTTVIRNGATDGKLAEVRQELMIVLDRLENHPDLR